MNEAQAVRLAAWVNTHDDGTEQPRAKVATNTDGLLVVLIGSQENRGGHWFTITEIARDRDEARAILGY